jgi:hypothetical protein
LAPAEVQANTRRGIQSSLSEPLEAGYTVDEEGFFNNYAIEPKMSMSAYPSRKQQRRYIFLGVGAFLFVLLALWLAFAVS